MMKIPPKKLLPPKNRKEICGVEDSEDSTGIQLVHKLVDKLPSNSVMFLDECPIKNSKKDSTNQPQKG